MAQYSNYNIKKMDGSICKLFIMTVNWPFGMIGVDSECDFRRV